MLFDKTGFYEPDNYDFAIGIISGNLDNLKLYDLEEALNKGNLFKSLYDKYKDYDTKKIIVNGERKNKLLDIQRLEFSINELNLYLDLHPEDVNVFKIFKKLIEDLKEKTNVYVKTYGPLELCDVNDTYEWTMSMFPWEEGK